VHGNHGLRLAGAGDDLWQMQMASLVLPVGVCLLFWWLGTGIVLRLFSLPERTHRFSVVGLSFLAALSLAGIYLLKDTQTALAAYLSFAAALVIWGWLELLHYTGVLVGPGTRHCPHGLSNIRRFFSALYAMLYHELAVAITGICLIVLTWGSANSTALYAYLVLWVMRVSAELNVFLGVAYLPEEWLPPKLRYLMSYRKTRRANALFPVSVLSASIVCIWMFAHLPAKSVDAFAHTSITLTGTLLLLAILEHWLLVLPSRSGSLWSWALSRAT
jgi:putative photosynthetic complex assembly protein 2